MRKLLFTAIALSFIFSVNAQKFGTKIGVNMSGVNSSTQLEDIQTAALENGLQGGFVFEFAPKKLGIRIEALYTQKGYNISTETTLIDGTTDAVTDLSLSLDYIEFPILLKYKLGPAYITAGPYFGYAISGEELTSITVDGQQLAEELYADQNAIPSRDVYEIGEFNPDNITYSRTDMGLNLGVGLKVLKFFAEARYGVGIANIKDYDNMPADDFTKNYTVSFSIGMFFN